MRVLPLRIGRILILSTGLILCSHPRPSLAEDPTAASWSEQLLPRMQSVYGRGEWRPTPLDAQWLPDSSGYVIRQRATDSSPAKTTVYDIRSGEAKEATLPTAVDRTLSPDSKRKIEVRGSNLFMRNMDQDSTIPLTSNPDQSSLSYHGFSWSPDGSHVVFIESDNNQVRTRSVLVPTDPSFPEVREDRFARIGETIPSLRIGVAARDGTTVQWLPVTCPNGEGYLGQVEWAGNSQEILIEALSRFRDRRDYHLYRLDESKDQLIYTESSDTWVTASQGTDLGLIWLRDGQQFILLSEKDGWRHAFLHQRDGKQIALLTPGEYDIIERGGVDEASGHFYFYASPTNGTQKYLYRVPLDGTGTLERISPSNDAGTHTYDFSPDCKWAFHTYSTFDHPPLIDLVSLPDHRSVRVLETYPKLQELAKKWISQPSEFMSLDIGAGINVDAWMLKPADFDATKKYPVFVYVYGEPHAQTVLDSWGAAQSPFLRGVADLGYLVVSIDNRGTPCPKGAAWRRAIFGSLGPLSTEEQAVALKELARTKPYVDLSRVGIWGWSGGGSNTLNALFRKPDVYHVGIAVVPKPQPHLYNAWFQEIYMRTPAVNAEGYQRSAPLNFADGLKGKLLIITGSGETNTHIQIIEGWLIA